MFKSRKAFSINSKIIFLTIMILLISSIIVSLLAISHFEKKLIPELDKKTTAIGNSISSLIIKALDYEIPFTALKGTEKYFNSVMKDNPEIKYLVITDIKGKVLYHGGADTRPLREYFYTKAGSLTKKASKDISSHPIKGFLDNSLLIVSKGVKMGVLHIGVDEKFVQNKTKDIMYDILTVLVVSLLVTFELLLFLVTFTISGPIESIVKIMGHAGKGDFTSTIAINSRDEVGLFISLYNKLIRQINESFYKLKESASKAKKKLLTNIEANNNFAQTGKIENFFHNFLIYIRTPLFLLIFAESLSLSFFPMFVNELYEPTSWISREIVIGLPISIFMLFWAFSLPTTGIWSERIGRKKPFLIGVLITAVGLILTGMSQTIFDLLVWRAITAVGYGMVYITCQGYISDNTTPKNRTSGMAIFLSGFFSGSLCGTAIGGILADRIGYRPTLFLSAGLALFSAMFVYNFLHDHKKREKIEKKKLQLNDFKILFRNKSFLVIIISTAIPFKICLTGFLYYAGPLYLKFLGNTQSAIGRVLMTYGLMMILISPLTGKIADRLGPQSRKHFILAGGIISGLGLLLMIWLNSTIGVLICISLVGLAHSIGVSSQLSLVTEICKEEAKVMGVGTVIAIFRLIERAGNISGPIIAGVLIAVFNFSTAIAGIGFITLTGAFIFIVAFFIIKIKEDGDKLSLQIENAK